MPIDAVMSSVMLMLPEYCRKQLASTSTRKADSNRPFSICYPTQERHAERHAADQELANFAAYPTYAAQLGAARVALLLLVVALLLLAWRYCS